MIQAGIPERQVMALCGHRTRSILDRYTIIHEDDLRQSLALYEGKFSHDVITMSEVTNEKEGESFQLIEKGSTERWPSGRRRLIRNQLCRKVPGVRIPLSPSFSHGEVRERLNRRAWRARGRQKRPVGSNPTLSARVMPVWNSRIERMIVLGGEVAVPCNPQSAIAGRNSQCRGLGQAEFPSMEGVEGWVLCDGEL
jgi:hypothetical protein